MGRRKLFLFQRGLPQARLLPGGHLWTREEGDGAAREGSGAQPHGLGTALPSWAARPGFRGSFLASRAPSCALAMQTGQMSAGSGVPWPAAGSAQTKALARRHPAFQRLGHELPVTQLFCPVGHTEKSVPKARRGEYRLPPSSRSRGWKTKGGSAGLQAQPPTTTPPIRPAAAAPAPPTITIVTTPGPSPAKLVLPPHLH